MSAPKISVYSANMEPFCACIGSKQTMANENEFRFPCKLPKTRTFGTQKLLANLFLLQPNNNSTKTLQQLKQFFVSSLNMNY